MECSGRGDCVCGECECTSPGSTTRVMNGQTVYILPDDDTEIILVYV